jgi:hypothetical protein
LASGRQAEARFLLEKALVLDPENDITRRLLEASGR